MSTITVYKFIVNYAIPEAVGVITIIFTDVLFITVSDIIIISSRRTSAKRILRQIEEKIWLNEFFSNDVIKLNFLLSFDRFNFSGFSQFLIFQKIDWSNCSKKSDRQNNIDTFLAGTSKMRWLHKCQPRFFSTRERCIATSNLNSHTILRFRIRISVRRSINTCENVSTIHSKIKWLCMEDWVSVRARTTQRELEEIVEELSCKLTCFTYEQISTKNDIVYQQFSLIFGRKFPHTHAQKILHKNGMWFFIGKTTTAYSQHCINFKSEEKAKAFYCFSIYSFVCYFTFFHFIFRCIHIRFGCWENVQNVCASQAASPM